MAKKVETESVLDSEELATEEITIPFEQPQIEIKEEPVVKQIRKPKQEFISCLTNERIIVRHIPKQSGIVTNPKHILYGGMAENAVRSLCAPKLSSGAFINVLTDAEKDYLERVMGLEDNALSIYKKKDNFWENVYVRLTKQDNFLNLADPNDYIKYKILLAWKDIVAPSLQELQNMPKVTYQFVIIRENEELQTAEQNMSTTMLCYKEFGKYENDLAVLKTVVELVDGRPISANSKIEFVKTKINELIQANPKLFLMTIKDPTLPTKVLIKKAIDNGLISNRGNMLYLKSDNSPLCEHNEEPNLSTAAKYLNHPRHQDLKFMIEAKLKL